MHNDNAPAYIKEERNDSGKLLHVSKHYYQYNHLHSPKDGNTPSIESVDYDDNGNVTNISHEYHKFGYEHNGVMSGVSSIYLGNMVLVL